MEDFFKYITPVLVFSLVAAGWMALQLVAKKMNIKNHIDYSGGCCGACHNKDNCHTSISDESFHGLSKSSEQ